MEIPRQTEKLNTFSQNRFAKKSPRITKKVVVAKSIHDVISSLWRLLAAEIDRRPWQTEQIY